MNKLNGVSLVQVIIALAVGLLLIAGLLSIFISMKISAEKINRYGELQENGRLAMSLITEDLMHQAFWGNLLGELTFSAIHSLPNELTNDCIGEGLNNRTFPQNDGHFRTLWGTKLMAKNALNCIKNGKVGSDVIQIKRVLSEPTHLSQLDKNRFYLITNTHEAAIFDASFSPPIIEQGIVWEYQHYIYYVREDSFGGNKIPVLMRGRLDSDNNPFHFSTVIDGIEFLHFTYGVDSNHDGLVNTFLSAKDMPEHFWDHESNSRILTVTVYVLVRELLPDLQYENINTYYLGDITLNFIDKNGKGDNYHRLLLTSTVLLQNSGVTSW